MPVTTPLRATYELASLQKRETVTATDLTLGGVFLETNEKPTVGALLSIEIESGTTKVEIDARVLAIRPGGFMASFIDLPNDVAATLQFIMSTRMPQRGTRMGLGAPEEGIPSQAHASEPRAPVAAPAPAAPSPPPAEPLPPVAPPRERTHTDPPRRVDSYAPRHPTPRMMKAAAASVPPGAPMTAPIAPVSSNPIPPVVAPSSGQLPQFGPRSYGPPPTPQKSNPFVTIIIAILVVAIVVVVGAAVVMFMLARRTG